MKKLVLTILTIFYLGASSGATVHFHYCMGQLIEWGLSRTNAEECGSCGRNESDTKKCCNNQSQQFKVEKSQKASLSVYDFNLPQLDLGLVTFIKTPEKITSNLKDEHYPGIQPQRTQAIPAFIRNCNFRI